MGSPAAHHAGGIVVITGALAMETAGIKRLGAFSRKNLQGITYRQGDVHGRDAALFISGIGGLRAFETARAALSALPVIAYISIGLSGSLSQDIVPGDVVVGVKVAVATEPDAAVYDCDGGLVKAAMGALREDPRTTFGALLSSEHVLVSSKEKMAAARSGTCLAVDMECAGAARAAYEAGVPFLAIRAVSDGLYEDMPVDFNRFSANGRISIPSLVFHVLTHPSCIGPLTRLGRNSRRAAANLADAVERVVGAI